MISTLGGLLTDEQPNHPQAVLDRARRPGGSIGSLARGLEDFFSEHHLALPTDQAEQLAAGRRQRRIDAELPRRVDLCRVSRMDLFTTASDGLTVGTNNRVYSCWWVARSRSPAGSPHPLADHRDRPLLQPHRHLYHRRRQQDLQHLVTGDGARIIRV